MARRHLGAGVNYPYLGGTPMFHYRASRSVASVCLVMLCACTAAATRQLSRTRTDAGGGKSDAYLDCNDRLHVRTEEHHKRLHTLQLM